VNDADIRSLLQSVRTIAVVGISDRPDRDSHRVAAYLKNAGYTIVPVNPGLAEVLGEKCWPSLRDVPARVDLVDVFRRPEFVPPIVEDAIAIGARALWLQDGVVHEEAAARAAAAGLAVVMDDCTMRRHFQLVRGSRKP
jgi:predicted CoA-binding protein